MAVAKELHIENTPRCTLQGNLAVGHNYYPIRIDHLTM